MVKLKNVVTSAFLIMCVIGLMWLGWHVQPTVSTLEDIHGIPYPIIDGTTQIQEQLAHTDVYLGETTFGRILELKIKFNPQNSKRLAVGVRENGFWLSYPKQVIWEGYEEGGWQEETISIPITNAFVDTDNSLDIMFFADSDPALDTLDAKTEETAQWQLGSLSVQTKYTIPSRTEGKDFIRSILSQERAL